MGASKRKDYVGPLSAFSIVMATAIADDTVTINGLVYTGVTGAKADNTEFSVDTSDTAAATDLADSINNDVRAGTIPTATLTATSSGAVVVVTSTEIVAISSSDSATIVLNGTESTLLSLLSNPAKNQATMKQITFMNTPFSVQQTGADKVPGRIVAVTNEAQFNALTTRQRVLWGNREGYIKTHTASTSLVFTWLDKTNTEVDTTKTMAEVIASGSLVFLDENY